MSNDTQPEIRFPEFTEEWEERKFGEIVQVSRGLTYKPSDVQIEGIRVLRSSNINEDVFILRDDDVFVKPDAVNIAPIKNGDILITSANGSSRLVGKHAIVNGLQDKTVHGGFMLRVKSKNTWFTNSLMSSRWYNYFINIYVSGGNGAIGNLRKYDLESQTIIVPDDEEQKKIGNFFKQLDDTIALHQRKLDLLKETKKGFLQKMFPKNGAKVPEIRFPGFTEDWEQRKLGEVVERVTRKNKKLESIRPLTISAQEGLIGQNEFFNKTVASRDVSGYYLVKKGEFAYNKSYSNGYPWGAVKRLNQYDMGVLSTLYIVFKPKKIDSDFLEKYYDTTYWYKEVSKHAAEGARNHGLLNIAASDFFETEIVMPLKIEEQQKIGAFFKQLDDTIALHQRELDVLKETKKGFLQKMFV